MEDLITAAFFSIAAAGFIVGIVVGLTGMGGGALMTPALIFLGVGETSAVVTADLTAAAVYKTGGAIVHSREGSPNLTLAKWLVLGSVPTALLGPLPGRPVHQRREPGHHPAAGDRVRPAPGGQHLRDPALHQPAPGPRRLRRRRPQPAASGPIPTLLVGMLGGLLVGITSVGSGSVIMVALLMLYPGLSAVRLVGTDLVQAVPLVLAAALANIAIHGLDWGLTIPLILGSVPGTIIGAKIAPRVPQSLIRRGIVVVLTMSGVALLDKAGWAPLGREETSPMLVAGIGLAMVVLVPSCGACSARSRACPSWARRPSPTSRTPAARGKKPTCRRATTPSLGRSRPARPAKVVLVYLLHEPGPRLRLGLRPPPGAVPGPRAERADPRPSCGSARTRVTRRCCPTADVWTRPSQPTPSGCSARRVHAEHGARLPFLMKVLAVNEPLSLQVHPSAERARLGFGREERRGRAPSTPRTAATATPGTSPSSSTP